VRSPDSSRRPLRPRCSSSTRSARDRAG
jgi:hypothetical protein